MLSPIELQRKKVELMRVQAARAELELTISEKLMEVERITKAIEIQKETEIKITNIIKTMEGESQ